MDLRARKFLLLLGDIAILYLALYLMLALSFSAQELPALFAAHVWPFSILFLFWLVIFYVLDLYDLSVPPASPAFLSRFALAILLCVLAGALFFYVASFTSLTPKTNLLIQVGLFGAMAYAWRLLFTTKLSRLAAWRIGLLGLRQEDAELRDLIRSLRHHGYECLDIASGDVAAQVRDQRLHAVVVPSGAFDDSELTRQLYASLETGAKFMDVCDAYELFARRIPLSSVNQSWFVRNVYGRRHGMGALVKRTMDVAVAAVLLVLTAPLWALIALAVKLDDGGPVFYHQERVGRRGVPFRIWKFRTMHIDAEQDGAQWATVGDRRATRVGGWLRATHLDELPQMLNIVRGDISLVGPRPERPMFVAQLERDVPHYHVRHLVKPGFTGWAQVKFRYARSVTDSRRKFEYDLYYIKNRNLILDTLILLKTAQLLFRRER